MKRLALATIVGVALAVTPARAQAPGSIVLRAGAGTDPELGLGIGLGAGYLFPREGTGLQISGDLFYHHSTEGPAAGDPFPDEEETWLTIFGARVDALFNYNSKGGVFYILGAGFVVGRVEWEERDLTTGQIIDGVDVTASGNIFNFGLGMFLSPKLQGRLEAPMLYFYGDNGNVSFVPTITLTLQLALR